jgi:urease accessory protein
VSEYRIGYNGQLKIATKANKNVTFPEQIFYSPPFKLAKYFRMNDGGIEYILMNASAGIMAGDDLDININVGKDCKLRLSSQSFEKIHKMEQGFARRITNITVASCGYFCYNQLPIIPFTDSAFVNQTTIHLENATSKLILSEILACGRTSREERFKYTYYQSLLNIFYQNKLVYRDNLNLNPSQINLNDFGFYENYSHMGMMIFYGFSNNVLSSIEPIIKNSQADSGLTQLLNNGYLIRGFAQNAESLINLFNLITNQINLLSS